jgi:hypothetical protein
MIWILTPTAFRADALENLPFSRVWRSRHEQVCFLACPVATGTGEIKHRH